MGANRKPRSKRIDIYQEVTNQIIRDLKQGTVPWVKPWADLEGSCPLSMPFNASSDRRYSGINILLLWASAINNRQPTQKWMTYRQAQALGGQVRKGEKGTGIVHVGTWTPKDERQKAKRDGEDAKSRSYLKRFAVFNTNQIENLPEDLANASPVPANPVPAIETLLTATGADFRIGGDRAFYVPSQDFIQVPSQQAFSDPIEYYTTCLHELTHWTSAAHRLDRKFKTGSGSKDYAKEELVAEMGAAFLCAHFGVQPVLRHADYLAVWLETLQEDDRAIIQTASAASKAAEFILSFIDADQGCLNEPKERAAA